MNPSDEPMDLQAAMVDQLRVNNETLAGLNELLTRVSDQLGIEAQNRERSIDEMRASQRTLHEAVSSLETAVASKAESNRNLRKSIRYTRGAIVLLLLVVGFQWYQRREERAQDCRRTNVVRESIRNDGFGTLIHAVTPPHPTAEQAAKLKDVNAKLDKALGPRKC